MSWVAIPLSMLFAVVLTWVAACRRAEAQHALGVRSGGPEAFPPGWNAYRRITRRLR